VNPGIRLDLGVGEPWVIRGGSVKL
jgi:hypothetical protein